MRNGAVHDWRTRFTASLSRLVDNRAGIIKTLHESPLSPGAPRFSHVYALASNTRAFCGQRNFANSGGAAADVVTAAAKAVGEAVERYCGAIFDMDEFPLTSAAAAGFNCVDPASFALHSPEQYARKGFVYVPFTEDTTVRWSPMADAATGEVVWAPAGMVYVPYFYHTHGDGRRDAPVAQPISTGLACHVNPVKAAISAICEVVERDSVMLHWQAMLAPPRIMVESLSDYNYDLVTRFESVGLEVVMFDLTTDLGIPTILSAIRSERPGEPAFIVAASTEPDPESAARKSLEELAHTRRYAHLVKRFSTDKALSAAPGNDFNVKAQQDHLLFWSRQDRLPLTDFLFASKRRIEFDDVTPLANRGDVDGTILAKMVNALGAAGHRTLLAELTTPDVADAGFAVVRAIVPGLHPMFMGHSDRALGGRRLLEAPERMGHAPFDPGRGDNMYPHPYP
ncbi:MAG: YcaO-like family protein [Nitrospinae bacterium]|nr:YcaO-like family protein [Nitrospinota bacterium]